VRAIVRAPVFEKEKERERERKRDGLLPCEKYNSVNLSKFELVNLC
jgi:hypothetical protein